MRLLNILALKDYAKIYKGIKMKHVENDHNGKECKEFNYLILIFDMVGDPTTWKGNEVIMLLCLSII
jgi:hypothetical protein